MSNFKIVITKPRAMRLCMIAVRKNVDENKDVSFGNSHEHLVKP